jgi:hypothetical protein
MLDLAAARHGGRELELMLAGRKPLALFYDDAGEPAGEAAIPEGRFDPYVARGDFVKGEAMLELPDPELGAPARVRYVLYALSDERWRIPAMVLALDLLGRTPGLADEGLERMICALLGYTPEETAACLDAGVLERC